jgi:hypothetical protein
VLTAPEDEQGDRRLLHHLKAEHFLVETPAGSDVPALQRAVRQQARLQLRRWNDG